MQTQLTLLIMCLLLAFAVPTWGGTNGNSKSTTPKKAAVVTAPAVPKATTSPSGYVRDPSEPMAMRQYLKELKLKQKEAAAKNAAAQAGKAQPQQTKGGAK